MQLQSQKIERDQNLSSSPIAKIRFWRIIGKITL